MSQVVDMAKGIRSFGHSLWRNLGLNQRLNRVYVLDFASI